MSFDLTAIFPFELAHLGSGSGWRTDVVVTASGAEQRNGVWLDALRKFNATTGIKTLADVQTIQKHFNGRRGQLRAFPILDRSSFIITVQENFGTGTGSATAFQLTLNEGDSANAYNREIYLPISGTLAIFDAGSPVTEGAGAGKFTCNYGTGVITFGTAPVNGHALTWTGQYYTPVRYASDQFPSIDLFVFRADKTGLATGPDLLLQETRDFN